MEYYDYEIKIVIFQRYIAMIKMKNGIVMALISVSIGVGSVKASSPVEPLEVGHRLILPNNVASGYIGDVYDRLSSFQTKPTTDIPSIHLLDYILGKRGN
ncbi:MAG: hypothetical protein LBJ92_04235 [Holosporales bacterium]|jgi:hypothetical protein|nr:hypothetical protein [Holosporales bacterium]